MPNWMNSIAARIVQDGLTSLAAYLSAQGFLTPGAQEQGFIGAAFFLIMLTINTFTHKASADANAVAGGMAVAEQSNNIPTSPGVVKAIIATAKATK